jgi:hypothetical protein
LSQAPSNTPPADAATNPANAAVNPADSHILSWSLQTADVPRGRRTLKATATQAECAAIASALGLASVAWLDATYDVSCRETGVFTLTGTLTARITQLCVVTLEPIETTLELPLSAEFREQADDTPPAKSKAADKRPNARDRDKDDEPGHALGDEIEVLALPEVEPVEQGTLAIGRVAFETLGAGIDPYPRKPDAHFDWQDPKADPTTSGPFAGLAALKVKD